MSAKGKDILTHSEDIGDESEGESSFIVLTNDDGNDLELEYLDRITYDGCDYAVMIPPESDDNDDDEASDVLILKIEAGEDDTDSYTVVEDDDTLSAVFEIFKDRFKDLFDFE